MKPKILTFLLILGALALSSCAKDDFTLTVLAKGENGCEVTGDAKFTATYGENLKIPITVPDGKSIVQVLSDGIPLEAYGYKDGTLTIGSVTSPQNIQIVAGDPSKMVIFCAEPDDTLGGRVSSTLSEWKVPVGTYATFTVTVNDGAEFLGWTVGTPLERGGELISTDLVLTTSAGDKNTLIFANFDTTNVIIPEPEKPTTPQNPQYGNYVEILYMGNGGTTPDGVTAKVANFNLDFYSYPNTLPNDGSFVRDGYVLVGYSTDPDGKDELIGMGHKYFDYDGKKSLDLYCIWEEAEPESSFKYTTQSNGTIAITGYTGKSEHLYIPSQIEGKKVTSIAANAFKGASMQSVYIPVSVTSVADNAFADCKKLTELSMFDSVTKISDASFSGTTLTRLQMNAAANPRYSNSYSAYGRKFERIMTPGPKIICVSGSSKGAGLDSAYCTELVGSEHTIVNYGTHANMCLAFVLEAISTAVDENDIVVYAPEQYGPHAYGTNGNPEISTVTWQGAEQFYNILSMVDISHYTKVFDNFAQYSSQRSRMKQLTYDQPSGKNKNGDRNAGGANARLNSPDFHYGANGDFRFCDDFFIEEFIPNMNRSIEMIQATGATVWFSHPPYNRNAVLPQYLNDESYDTYHAYLEEVLSAPLISDVRNYILGGEYFYDTDYHPNDFGRKLHTEQLAKDIRAALDKNIK